MNVGRKTLGVLLRKIIVITVCVYSISTTHQSYAGTTGGLPPITNRLSKSNEKPIIESYRSYSSFLEYKYYAPKKYADQFLGKKASDCDELIVENQTEGTFCLYVFYKTNGNAQDAFRHLLKSAQMRNPLAERELAWAYEKGYGTSTNKESHAYWQLKAAESGQHNAQLGLGWAYMSSPSAFPTDYQKAMIWNVASFNNGNGEAAANIGLLYENGWGVPINYQLAADWYMRAINSDGTYSGQAEARLAWLYQKGLGLSQNVNEAKSLYEKILYRLPRPGSDWKEKAEYQLNLINKSR